MQKSTRAHAYAYDGMFTRVQDFRPRISLSEEDFAVMTRQGALLDPSGESPAMANILRCDAIFSDV